MQIRVEADARGAQRALAALNRLRAGPAGEPAEGLPQVTLFTRIGITVLRWVDENFRSAGGKVGGWLPLRPLTLFGKRVGKGTGTPQPLAGLQKVFTFQATAQEARVGAAGQLGWIAKWQSEGTKPYDIYPRNKKALAFPAPPLFALSAGVGFFARRVPTGRKGAATPRGEVPHAGLTTATAIRAAGFKPPPGKGKIKSFAVVRHVHHPGLPPRRILPTVEEITPTVNEVVQDFLRELGGLSQ